MGTASEGDDDLFTSIITSNETLSICRFFINLSLKKSQKVSKQNTKNRTVVKLVTTYLQDASIP